MLLDHLDLTDDVIALSRSGDMFCVSLRWRREDVPYLLTLPSQAMLGWPHIDDPGAGIPVSVVGWTCRNHGTRSGADSSRVDLYLRLQQTGPCADSVTDTTLPQEALTKSSDDTICASAIRDIDSTPVNGVAGH